MPNTYPFTGTEAIEHLDFTPKCEVAMSMRVLLWWLPTGVCKRSAKWMAILPCCGLQVFSCHKHRTGRSREIQECAGCGKKFYSTDSWRWMRI